MDSNRLTEQNVQLKKAMSLALNNNWNWAHNIAQDYESLTANWLYDVLHKIEGDLLNCNDWYVKTDGKKYADFLDVKLELNAILILLELGI